MKPLQNIGWNFIALMEENMPRTNKEAAVGYGKLLVHAWGKGSGNQKQCIEDFVKKLYDDVAQLQRKGIEMCHLGNIILRIFEMFHTDEAPLPLKTSISRRCIPILFGYLKSHVNRQRCNASELFFKMYPLMMYSTRDKECSFLDKQHTLIEELLRDKCHIVRVLAVMGTCRIITENADTVPKATVNTWLAIIVEELSQDSKSYLVRCYVSKGFKKLLSSKLPSTYLETMMSKMNHLYSDVNAQVREAYSELLMKTLERDVNKKTCGKQSDQGIRWWKIVPLKALLTQVELEDCGTRKWQASLLFCSSILKDKSGTEIVRRIVTLATLNSVATNKLFIFMGKKLVFEQVVEIISAIILKINKYVEKNRSRMYKMLASDEQKLGPSPLKKKKRKRLDKENVIDDDCSVTSEEFRNEEHVSNNLDRPAIMQTLLNIASILWRTFIKAFEDHPKELRELHKICQAYIPKWFSFFKGTVVFDCLLLLMTHLPADQVSKMSGLQMSLMSQLKQLPADVPDAAAKSLLVPLVMWGNGRDILELIQDWFNEAFRICNLNWTLSTLGRRRKVSVIDAIPAKPLLAVRFVSIMYQHPVCWDKLLAKCFPQLKEFWSFLERVNALIVQRLEAGQPLENELVSDDFIRESLRLHLKLIPFLGSTDRSEQQFDAFRSYGAAIQFAIENMLPHLPDAVSEAHRPESALVVNLLNDVLDVGCHPLLLVQPPLTYIKDMHCLASKLLKSGCGPLFVVFSMYVLGNTVVHLKGQVGKLDKELLVFLYSKCILQLSCLVLARMPGAKDDDLQLCFQEQEVFKTVMSNVLGSSRLFIDFKSPMMLRLYVAYVDAVVELLSHDGDRLVSASCGKTLKDLPVAVAKMVSIVLAHSDQAHAFCLALMYRFKRPHEDCDVLLAALKLLCVMSSDSRWAAQMLQHCLLTAEEAVSTEASSRGEDFQREASQMISEVRTRQKQLQSVVSVHLETPSSVVSSQHSQEEDSQPECVPAVQPQSEPLRTGIAPSRMAPLLSSPPLHGARGQQQDSTLEAFFDAVSQSPSSSLHVNGSQSGQSYLDSFEAASQIEELEELPLAPVQLGEPSSDDHHSDVESPCSPALRMAVVQAEEQFRLLKVLESQDSSPLGEPVMQMPKVMLPVAHLLPAARSRSESPQPCSSWMVDSQVRG